MSSMVADIEEIRPRLFLQRWSILLRTNPRARWTFVLIGTAGFFAIVQFGLENLGVKLPFPVAAVITALGLLGLSYSILTAVLVGRDKLKLVIAALITAIIGISVRDQIAER